MKVRDDSTYQPVTPGGSTPSEPDCKVCGHIEEAHATGVDVNICWMCCENFAACKHNYQPEGVLVFDDPVAP